MNPALRRSAAHVFVESIDAPALAADDRHHLSRVLRLRAGETVSVSDGDGAWRLCALRTDHELDAIGPVEHIVAEAPAISVGFALPKGDRPEWIVQKLTEIGVDRIIVLHTARSVVRWDGDRVERNMQRVQRIAREASMQSRRVRLPNIEGPTTLSELVTQSVALAEPGGDALSLGSPTVLVGPEGGWTDVELAAVPTRCGLGRTVLRVETAAVVAGTRLIALRDGWGGSDPADLHP